MSYDESDRDLDDYEEDDDCPCTDICPHGYCLGCEDCPECQS
jgi:hypothetical protein